MVLDPSYFVEQLQPLLRVEHQQDMPNQLGDLAELALWVLRIVLQVHLLHFVPPSDSPQRDWERLPGEVHGVRPERVDLVSAAGPGSAPPRLLSRYRPAERRAGTRPVMLIHGYGASGSTFAHKSIPANLVHSLLEAGRDVWVLELRTSIGFAGRPRAYWSFDEVAEADIPDALRTVQAAYATPDDAAPVQVDVVAHCIGAAMFSVAVLRSPDLHASIGAVVLSQVGPLLRATAFNRFRGYVAGYLQQFIGTDEFDTRPASTACSRPFPTPTTTARPSACARRRASRPCGTGPTPSSARPCGCTTSARTRSVRSIRFMASSSCAAWPRSAATPARRC
jgi:pimeloyl-ACP methyl ester carboxylesterase